MEIRKKFIETLTEYLISDDVENEHILLNGKWGSGKTYTIDKTKQLLNKKDDVDVIYFNSWKYDYHTYPQFALVESILDEIVEKERNSQIKLEFLDNAKEYAEKNESFSGIGAINTILGRLLNVDFSKVKITENFSSNAVNTAYNKIVEENIFATALSYLIEKNFNKKKIIIFIDELDRVKPDFCIKTIEFFHHLSLENKNIVVVYAADIEALISLIDHFYGFGKKSINYIEKVVQTIFNLPALNYEDYENFIIESSGVTAQRQIQLKFGHYDLSQFSEVLSLQEIPLRTVQVIVREIILKDETQVNGSQFWLQYYDTKDLLAAFDRGIDSIKINNSLEIIQPINYLNCINILYILKYIQLSDSDYKLTIRDNEIAVELSQKVLEIQSIILHHKGTSIRSEGQLLWVKQVGNNSKASGYAYKNDMFSSVATKEEQEELSTIYELIKIIFNLDSERRILR